MTNKKKPTITIYCDGCCKGNQYDENIGAWAYRVEYGSIVREDSGVAENTTNNQMELLSCIKALQLLKNPKGFEVEVVSDSQYLVKGMTEWLPNWIKRGWRNSQNKAVENQKLWQELDNLAKIFDKITFLQVKGHADNAGNNRVDWLCNQAIKEYKNHP